MSSRKSLKESEDGVVAIVVAIIVTVIISVITIAFARIMRREQRQALDRQLNTQAFYAAESAANWAIKYAPEEKTECVTPSLPPLNSNNVETTCLLIDDTPEELEYDGISTDEPTIFNIRDITEPTIDFSFNWENASDTSTWDGRPFSYPTFSSAAEWGADRVGVLEVIVYPLRSGVNSRDTIISESKTFYLYPSTGNPSPLFADVDGQVIQGHCDPGAGQPRTCRTVINDFPGAASGITGYVFRLRAIYNPLSLEINGEGVPGTRITLNGAQKLIDVTSRASDVRRRIQIRLPVKPSYNLPIYAVETAGDLCKRLDVWPGGARDNCDPDGLSDD